MKSIWMLAAAQETDGPLVTMEEAPASTTTTTQDNGAAPLPEETERTPQSPLMLVMFLILGVYIFLIMFRGPKKKQQEHQKMVASLKKNDRVQTIGGILGTVLDVRDDEILLKIDEGNNTKMRFVPSAIARVLSNGKTE
jgi:preprotein translocase subunit YajC